MKKNILVETLHRDIQTRLSPRYDTTIADQYAWWVLESILRKSKAELVLASTVMLSAQEEQTITEWLWHLVDQHMPIQYLIGSIPFGDLTIFVQKPILIPRPETENWCFTLIERLQQLPEKNITVLDLCTGTGCVGLAIAKAFSQATVTVTDINKKALDLAQKNATYNKINNVSFVLSDVYQELPADAQYDLIVSNPPYVTEAEYATLEPSVALWEDKGALVAEQEGLACIERIIAQAPMYIRGNDAFCQLQLPQLVIEIGAEQGAAVKKLMIDHGLKQVVVEKDLETRDRVVSGNVCNTQKKRAV